MSSPMPSSAPPLLSLQKTLYQKNICCALFLNLSSEHSDPTIAYLSGYTGSGALVVPSHRKTARKNSSKNATSPFLIVPSM
ncbi:hypothetical protein COY95_01145, partial [Candidatus Woesearchaeota archaeon CG_4_10_14_0_8_um_filter_47_5]